MRTEVRPIEVVRRREIPAAVRTVWEHVSDPALRRAWLGLYDAARAAEEDPPRQLVLLDDDGGQLTIDLVPLPEDRTRVQLTVTPAPAGVRQRLRQRSATGELVRRVEDSLRALDVQLRDDLA